MSYDAFISYDHADADVATAVHRALHRIAKPAFRLRALRVFLDRASLSPGEPLPVGIEKAIRDSKYLILIASPASARSSWVAREVGAMIAANGANRLILILADGDLAWAGEPGAFEPSASTALAPALHDAFRQEPLWIDLRPARQAARLSLKNPEFRNRLVAVAAPLHGKPKDELESDDHRLQRKAKRIATAATGVLLAALVVGTVASVNWSRAAAQRAYQERVRRAGELTALAAAVRSDDLASLRRKGLLAIQALHAYDRDTLRSADADETLREVLGFLPISRDTIETGVGSIETIAFTDDGRELVVGGRGSVIARITMAGLAVQRIARPGPLVRGASLSADGAFLVTADYNPDPPGHWLEVHDATTGRSLGRRLPGGRITAIAPGGRFLATVHDFPRAQTVVWDLDAGQVVARLQTATGLTFSRDGRRLALAGFRPSVWRIVAEDTAVDPAVVVEREWQDRSAIPAGEILFGGGGAPFVVGSDRAGPLARSLDPGGAAALPDRALPRALARDGRLSAEVSVYDVVVHDALGTRSARIPFGAQISALAFSPTEDLLAIAGIDGRVALWAISDGSVAASITGVPPHDDLAFVGDSTALVTVRQPAHDRGFVNAPDLRVRSALVDPVGTGATPLRAHAAGPSALSADGRFLAVADSAGAVTIRNVVDDAVAARVDVGPGVRSLALDEHGRRIGAVTSQEIRVFDVGTGRRIASRAHEAEEVVLALSGGSSIALLHDRWTENAGTRRPVARDSVTIVDLGTGHTLRTADPSVRTPRLGPLGDRIFWEPQDVLAGSRTVTVETLADSTLRTLPGAFAAISADGSHLATIDGSRVRIWDLDRGEVARIPNAAAWAALALGPRGRFFATSADGTIRLWTLVPDDLIRLGCARLLAADLDSARWAALVPEVPWTNRACVPTGADAATAGS